MPRNARIRSSVGGWVTPKKICFGKFNGARLIPILFYTSMPRSARIRSSVGGWVINNFANQWVFCLPL